MNAGCVSDDVNGKCRQPVHTKGNGSEPAREREGPQLVLTFCVATRSARRRGRLGLGRPLVVWHGSTCWARPVGEWRRWEILGLVRCVAGRLARKVGRDGLDSLAERKHVSGTAGWRVGTAGWRVAAMGTWERLVGYVSECGRGCGGCGGASPWWAHTKKVSASIASDCALRAASSRPRTEASPIERARLVAILAKGLESDRDHTSCSILCQYTSLPTRQHCYHQVLELAHWQCLDQVSRICDGRLQQGDTVAWQSGQLALWFVVGPSESDVGGGRSAYVAAAQVFAQEALEDDLHQHRSELRVHQRR